MKQQINQDPWKHIVVDDVLPPHLFEAAQEVCKQVKVTGSQKTIFNASWDLFGDLVPNDVSIDSPNSVTKNLYTTMDVDLIEDIYEYMRPMLFDWLDQLGESAEAKYIRMDLQSVGPDYTGGWHVDRADKLLSVVVYLYPEEHKGTLLGKEFDSYDSEVEWKPNRAVVFCGKKNHTWHAFEGNGVAPRHTFIFNIMG